MSMPRAWLLVAACLVFASSLTACSSRPVARGYVQGKAGLQAYESDAPDAAPITAPYEIEGNVKVMINPWKKPIFTLEVLDETTTIHTTLSPDVPGAGVTRGRLDGSGLTDEGKVLILRPLPRAASAAPGCPPPVWP
jgi:hypothetical protein